MVRVRLIVAENLRGHVNARKFIPQRNLRLVLGSPKNAPGVRRLRERGSVIEQRVWSPHERNAVDLAFVFHQRRIAKSRGELIVRRNLREIERRSQPRAHDRRSDVARRRDDIVIGGAAAAKLGDKLVARAHVRRNDFAIMRLLERLEERRVRVAFPHQQAQRFGFRLAAAESSGKKQNAEGQRASHHNGPAAHFTVPAPDRLHARRRWSSRLWFPQCGPDRYQKYFAKR